MHLWLPILLFVLSFQETGEPGKRVRLEWWQAASAGVQAEVNGTSIRVSKGSGWIRTTDEFLDFVLHMRFRVLTADAEGAVLLRAWQRKPGERPSTGYRVALAGPAVKRRGPAITGLSANTRAVSGRTDSMVPADGLEVWHELTVVCRRDRVTMAVDGRELGAIEGGEPQAGAVGIEARKGAIEFDDVWVIEEQATIAPLHPGPEGPPFSSSAPVSPAPDVTPPEVVSEVKPRYTIEALAAGTQGLVRLELIVLPDGRVGDVRVVRPLRHDLDLEAVAAARRWRFKPATRAGVAVPVLVALELTFILGDRQ